MLRDGASRVDASNALTLPPYYKLDLIPQYTNEVAPLLHNGSQALSNILPLITNLLSNVGKLLAYSIYERIHSHNLDDLFLHFHLV